MRLCEKVRAERTERSLDLFLREENGVGVGVGFLHHQVEGFTLAERAVVECLCYFHMPDFT